MSSRIHILYRARRWSLRYGEAITDREYALRDSWWPARHLRVRHKGRDAMSRRPYQHYIDNRRPKRWDLPW